MTLSILWQFWVRKIDKKEKLKRKWGLCRERFILDLGVVKCDHGEELSIALYRHWQHHHTILLKPSIFLYIKTTCCSWRCSSSSSSSPTSRGVRGGAFNWGSWRCAAAKGNKELHQARTLQRNYDAKRRSLWRITVNHHNLPQVHSCPLLQGWLTALTQRHLLLAYMDTTCHGWLGAWIYLIPMKRAS